MQLILEADNSNINIKEKMTTVEESIDILMNGVADIERTPEKEKGSNTDRENILNNKDNVNLGNGDNTLLEELPAPPCNDISEKNNPKEDVLSNSDKQNSFNEDDIIVVSHENVEAEDKTVLEEVSAQPCVESSENESLEKETVMNLDTENSLNGHKVTEIQNNIGSGEKFMVKEVPAPLCEDVSINKNLEAEKLLNLDITNTLNVDITESKKNIVSENKGDLERPSSSSEVVPEHEFLETQKSSDKADILNGDIFEINKDNANVDKTVIKETPAPSCKDVSENNSTKSIDASHVLLETCKITTQVDNNAESRINISDKTELSLDKQLNQKPEECFKDGDSNTKNIAEKHNKKLEEHATNQNKLETENPEKISKEIETKDAEKISEHKFKDTVENNEVKEHAQSKNKEDQNDIIEQIKENPLNSQHVNMNDANHTVDNKVDNSVKLCKNKEDQNDIVDQIKENPLNSQHVDMNDGNHTVDNKVDNSVKLCKNKENQDDIVEQIKENPFNSQHVDMNDVIHTLDNKVDNSEAVNNSSQEYSNNINECNFEKQSTEKVKDSITESENFTKNTSYYMQTVSSKVVDITEISTINENIDMECEETVPIVTELNDSTLTPMDCDRNNDSDLIEKDLLNHATSIQIAIKEDTQVVKTDSLTKETTTEESNQVENVKNKPNEIQDENTSTSTESTVVEKMDTSEETETIEIIKENETPKTQDNTIEVEKILGDFNDTKESMEKEKSDSVSLNVTDSTSTESTVVEKMDTSEETETIEIIKENEIPKTQDNTVEVEKILSGFNDTKESMEKEKSDSVSLNVTDTTCKDVNSDIEEVKVIDIQQEAKSTETPVTSKVAEKPTPVVCKLSNTLNILSDDEDEPPKTHEIQASSTKPNDKQCINIEDDDDVMVIEDTVHQDKPESVLSEGVVDNNDVKSATDSLDGKISDVIKETMSEDNDVKDFAEPQTALDDSSKPQILDEIAQEPTEKIIKEQPLLPKDLFKSYKKNLTEMTRDDLEDFVILKIVESIIDRSSLNEIKTKLKTMAQTIEEYKKKSTMLTKQNRDLQVVLKSIQEEQKKGGDTPIVPLKITRSVGMQVLMTDKNTRRKVNPTPSPGPSLNVNNRPVRNVNQGPRQQAPINETNQQIPVPRLVPASNNAAANKTTLPVISNRITAKPNQLSMPNSVRSPPAPKVAEKRGRTQSSQSITVDLTDDEPPPKIQATKTSPAPPVRLVPSQNLLGARAQTTSNTLANPRKVYIPIGSNQNQNVRPGQTIMLKNVPPNTSSGPRPRGAAPMGARGPTPNQIRMGRVIGRHPAPLPDAIKQYQPPNWKALPPAPDLKLSKVENGIVISWKIDGYQEDSYEEIASYQLYAYQETSSPPNTTLWKKIGDVKALPLPMACTLTQFMAGYKYYFAVRAVDIRSRLGPFSLPGSILLLNKM